MIKARKRWLSILLTVTFVISIMLPLGGVANAATTYGALTTPTVVPPATTALGTILITIDTLGSGPHKAVFTLPTDFDRGTPVATLVEPSGAAISPTIDISGYGSNEFRLDVTASAVYSDVKISVALPDVDVPSDASGDITCTITQLAGQLASGSVVVGKASTGQVDLSVVETPSITSSGTSSGKIQINLKENAAGGLKVAATSLKFTLPSGFEWTGTPTIINVADGSTVTSGVYANIDSDARKLIIKREGTVGAKLFYRVKTDISVDESTAKFGDVVATVSGDSSYSPSDLTVAKYQDYGVTITGKTTEEVIAGRTDQEVGDFYIEEAAPGSLINGRTLTLKLPANAKWVTEPSVTVEKGNVVLSSWSSVDDRTIKATVTGSTTASKVLLKDAKVKLAVDTAGDLAIEVGGTAGATGSVVVAKVVAPISASAASTPNLKIGEQSQAAGDITITEGKKEAIDKITSGESQNDLVLEAPTGVEFAAVPTVSVTDGDLVVDKVTKSGRYVYIELKSTSSKASTIKVSDIKYTVDRTVPVGPIEVKIKGDGVNKTAADFANATVAAKVVNANCVTPAPGDQKVTTALTIGNTTMKVNDQEVAMDVAPYIKDGRTMISVRWVAQALGISSENVVWDGAAKTVTIMTSSRVVQMKIGSKTMLVNGASITMDAAAEIVPPGRTCIPMRFLAQALGAKVSWDEGTQTATFEL